MVSVNLNFDGSIGPKNPGGTAAYGYLVTLNGSLTHKESKVIGSGPEYSNNYAEVYALYKGLEKINSLIKGLDDKSVLVSVRGDSQIAINMMKKVFKAKQTSLYFPAYKLAEQELLKLRRAGCTVMFDWIPRRMNAEADALADYKTAV
jgi:ribonuclease HI